MTNDFEINEPVSLSLAPYSGQWTQDEAAHLLRRALFGPTYQQIQDAVSNGMAATVIQLLTTTPVENPEVVSTDEGVAPMGGTWVSSPLPTSNAADTETARRNSLAAWIMQRLNSPVISIQEQMCLFWQNHFAAEFTFDSRATFNYHEVIRTHCLGNFKQLVKDITIDPNMLLFLSGNENNQFDPNENFARELFELYTIGKGPQIGPGDYTNFKEEDIQEASKILTGWVALGLMSTTENNTYSEFIPFLHDTSTKTLSEHFDFASITPNGANEYEDLIDVIFLQDEVANFICRKLYRWFVNYDLTSSVENTIIAEMAETFRTNNYEIEPVLSELFQSEHFYDIALRGAIIRNPLEYLFSILNSTQASPNYSTPENYDLYLQTYGIASTVGMNYAQPPSVGGWTAYYQAPSFSQLWVNATYIKLRFNISDWLAFLGGFTSNGNNFEVNHLDFLDSLSLPADPNAVIDDIILVFYPKGLDSTKRTTLKTILTNGLPDFEWTLQYNEYASDPTNPVVSDPVKQRIALTLAQAFKMPEFQTI